MSDASAHAVKRIAGAERVAALSEILYSAASDLAGFAHMPRLSVPSPASVSYQEALSRFQKQEISPAELASHYLVERVWRRFGRRWRQAKREKPLSFASSSDLFALISTWRLCGVPEPAARALCSWGEGKRPIRLLFTIPSPLEILTMQSRGERCLSLLEDAAVPAPHRDGLDFALHDLCHVEKFVDPEHYHGQVGFFSMLARAIRRPEWQELDKSLDDTWRSDLERVMADMNGSPIFLWVALKAGLRPALHRREHPNEPFQPQEESPLYRETLTHLLAWFGFPPEVQEDARLVNDRHSHREASQRLARFFAEVGRASL